MKAIVLSALLFTGLMSAQATRFIYSVQMKPDSTNRSEVKSEKAYLDTDGKKSLFISERAVLRDSLFQRSRQTQQMPDRSQMENMRSSLNYSIAKDFGKQEITFNNRIGRDNYSYTEKVNLDWNISSETAKVDEYTTQKATTTFGGRKWTAWFTNDFPVSDGPYKFSGLPGLIVKLEDDKGDYVFQLIQTKKIPQIASLEQRGQTIKAKKSDYLKTEKRFNDDPEEFMKASMASGGGRGFGGPGGGGSGGGPRPGGGNGPSQEQIKEMRERMLKDAKSNNNPIELK